MQIIISPPEGIAVWWYTPRKSAAIWYIQATRPARGGEFAGVEYCILASLNGTAKPRSVRYEVSPSCGLGIRYLRVFSSKQFHEARLYTRCVASMAYRLPLCPSANMWWHKWSSHLNDKLEPFHAH